MKQVKLPLKYKEKKCECGCIFNHMEIPKDNQWVYNLIDKHRNKERKKAN